MAFLKGLLATILLSSVSALALAAPPDLTRPPGQIAAMAWVLPNQSGSIFQSLSIDVDVSRDPPKDLPLYIAPFGLFALEKNEKHVIYGGLQNIPEELDRIYRQAAGTSSNCVPTGSARDGILSRWGDRDRTAMVAEKPDGVTCEKGDEDDFVSVHRPVRWGRGHYTLTVTKVSEDSDGRPWIALDVTDKATDQTTRVGRLRLFERELSLHPMIYSFVEIFYGGVAAYKGEAMKVTIDNLRYNGNSLAPKGVIVRFKDLNPTFADASSKMEGQITIEMGTSHDRSGLPTNGLTGDDASHCRIFNWSPDTKLDCY